MTSSQRFIRNDSFSLILSRDLSPGVSCSSLCWKHIWRSCHLSRFNCFPLSFPGKFPDITGQIWFLKRPTKKTLSDGAKSSHYLAVWPYLSHLLLHLHFWSYIKLERGEQKIRRNGFMHLLISNSQEEFLLQAKFNSVFQLFQQVGWSNHMGSSPLLRLLGSPHTCHLPPQHCLAWCLIKSPVGSIWWS